MLKQLETLIRLHKMELDDKRRQLARLEDARDQILSYITAADTEMEREKDAIRTNPEIHPTFPAYRENYKRRKTALEEQLAACLVELNAMAEEVTEAYQVLKKYEVALENKQAEIKKERAQKEQEAADEQALQTFRRGE